MMEPRMSEAGERRAVIDGRLCSTGPDTFWIDLIP